MGRRALPKVDPELDFASHLRTVDTLPAPWNPAEIFCREAPLGNKPLGDKPLEIEVGSGKGLFLQNAAIAQPEHDFLGVEVSAKYARFTAARLSKREISNAMSVHGRLAHKGLYRVDHGLHFGKECLHVRGVEVGLECVERFPFFEERYPISVGWADYVDDGLYFSRNPIFDAALLG